MGNVTVGLGLLVLVLLVLGYALAPLLREEILAETFRVFIVCYVLLLGLHFMFSCKR